MKSQYIKIRNIPEEERKSATTIRVKPWYLLFVLLFLAFFSMLMKAYLLVLGAATFILTLFALLVMPDRILIQFMKDYMVLYNRADRDECTMIYYDEIVSWYYEYHRNSDLVVIEVLNFETQSVDMFSKRILRRYMRRYVPEKEKKSNRRRLI